LKQGDEEGHGTGRRKRGSADQLRVVHWRIQPSAGALSHRGPRTQTSEEPFVPPTLNARPVQVSRLLGRVVTRPSQREPLPPISLLAWPTGPEILATTNASTGLPIGTSTRDQSQETKMVQWDSRASRCCILPQELAWGPKRRREATTTTTVLRLWPRPLLPKTTTHYDGD
jgi:hypothetical protein